jgi:holo-[acyl-carrier protein] synthase
MKRAIGSRHFVARVFRPSEIAYAEEKGKAAASSYAAAFAAREAFAKASGLPFAKIALSSLFRLERENGVPRIVVEAELDGAFRRGDKTALVSLSHDGDYAVAVVVIEKA